MSKLDWLTKIKHSSSYVKEDIFTGGGESHCLMPRRTECTNLHDLMETYSLFLAGRI